jgi:hypothetical protein
MDATKHTAFQFQPPFGAQFVVYATHNELRFEKTSGKTVLDWWRQQGDILESQLEFLTQSVVYEKCESCSGTGASLGKACQECHGSGRKGFVPPGLPKSEGLLAIGSGPAKTEPSVPSQQPTANSQQPIQLSEHGPVLLTDEEFAVIMGLRRLDKLENAIATGRLSDFSDPGMTSQSLQANSQQPIANDHPITERPGPNSETEQSELAPESIVDSR